MMMRREDLPGGIGGQTTRQASAGRFLSAMVSCGWEDYPNDGVCAGKKGLQNSCQGMSARVCADMIMGRAARRAPKRSRWFPQTFCGKCPSHRSMLTRCAHGDDRRVTRWITRREGFLAGFFHDINGVSARIRAAAPARGFGVWAIILPCRFHAMLLQGILLKGRSADVSAMTVPPTTHHYKTSKNGT